MTPQPMKYNPAFLSDEDLAASFVTRHVDLDLLCEVLRENIGAPANQHVLILGPRGYGKTTLAHRVALAARTEPDLKAAWYPITYGEESYQVTSAGEFWLEALFHLAEQTGKPQWAQAHAELLGERDEERLRIRALALLMDFADAQGKRLLFVVENLHMLFGQQLGEDAAWSIRHTLMNEPRVMLLGTAVTRFEAIDAENQALYELFRLFPLDPLDEAACQAVWVYITGAKLPGRRMRPIQILTGGNPRLLRIIAAFATNQSFAALMNNLTRLVDEHTEYFKSHLDGLAPQERKVFTALADLWDPASTREVATQARLDVNKTSSFLNRLQQRGAISVHREEGRKKYYIVTERMYNIYHLMRRRGHAASRVRCAIQFMLHYYAPEERSSFGITLVHEALTLAPNHRHDHRYDKALEALDQAISIDPNDFHVRGSKARLLYELNRFDESADAYRLAWAQAEQAQDPVSPVLASLVLGLEGDWPAALSQAENYLQDSTLTARCLSEVICFGTEAAAAGQGHELLALLKHSPSAEILEPLLVALEMDQGNTVHVAIEIQEVARDIVARINSRRAQLTTT